MSIRFSLLLFLCIPALAWQPAIKADALAEKAVQVRSLLKNRCFSCHGSLSQKAGLRLDSVGLMKKGGESGAAIEPGNAQDSELVDRICSADAKLRMPPEGSPLSPAEIDLVKAWINSGAPAPPNDKPEPDPRSHWAFQKPVKAPMPNAASNPVDAFVSYSLNQIRLKPLATADKATLIRRATLDLTGLPPTHDELLAFLADDRPDAYRRVIDRLLASKAYGERWARHWMDIWRYSDWYGRRYVPDVWNSAPQVYRWRDWIIDSLNADTGYDRMVQMMLAADEIAPGDQKNLVATGYLVRNWYALNPHQWKRDIVEHTGKAFLGLTFNCAHCHDHKYDPIRQDDYFKFRAYFEPIELRQDRWPGEADPGPFQKYDYSVLRKIVMNGSIGVFDEKPDARVPLYRGGDERDIRTDREPMGPGMPALLETGNKPKPLNLPTDAYYPGLKPWLRKALLEQAEGELAAAHSALNQAATDLKKQAEASAVAVQAENDKTNKAVLRLKRTEIAIAAMQARQMQFKSAMARLELARGQISALNARTAADDALYASRPDPKRADTLRIAAIDAEWLAAGLARQNALAQAELAAQDAELQVVSARDDAAKTAAQAAKTTAATALTKASNDVAAAAKLVKPATYTPLSPIYKPTSSGRRKSLAENMTRNDHPLTARVAVNHIWNWHFGRPLVDTVADFGRNGKAPSHPELLDWLAVEFMENGWSLKHLHRLIMTSEAYQRASASADQADQLARDPENRLYWRFQRRRLEGEAIRDSILASTGTLDRTAGGPPVENTAEAESKSLRRTVYFATYPESGGRSQFMETFDAPDACDAYKRTRSIVPQQALAMVNSTLIQQQSGILAAKLWEKATKSETQREKQNQAFIRLLFETCLSRQPMQAEAEKIQKFLAPGITGTPEEAAKARAGLVRVIFNHDDFLSIR
ncbi:MAG: PSD1 and planctomycete cytochrome C domain-containing protein [Isosphaeraceae bacterium]